MANPGNGMPLLVTARDAAAKLSISERTLCELTNNGDLPCIRIGRSVRHVPTDLEQWVEKKRSG